MPVLMSTVVVSRCPLSRGQTRFAGQSLGKDPNHTGDELVFIIRDAVRGKQRQGGLSAGNAAPSGQEAPGEGVPLSGLIYFHRDPGHFTPGAFCPPPPRTTGELHLPGFPAMDSPLHG